MEKLTEEEFNKKYKEDPAFKAEVDKVIAQRKSENEDIGDGDLENVSGGGIIDYLNPFNYYYDNFDRANELEEKEKELWDKKLENETLNDRLDRYDNSNRGLNPGDPGSDHKKGTGSPF